MPFSKQATRRWTHPNLPIFCASREVLAIGGETDSADVEISLLGDALVVERAAERASAHVENLGGAIAPGGEPHALLKRTQQTTLSWLNWCTRLTLSDWGTRGL